MMKIKFIYTALFLTIYLFAYPVVTMPFREVNGDGSKYLFLNSSFAIDWTIGYVWFPLVIAEDFYGTYKVYFEDDCKCRHPFGVFAI